MIVNQLTWQHCSKTQLYEAISQNMVLNLPQMPYAKNVHLQNVHSKLYMDGFYIYLTVQLVLSARNTTMNLQVVTAGLLCSEMMLTFLPTDDIESKSCLICIFNC